MVAALFYSLPVMLAGLVMGRMVTHVVVRGPASAIVVHLLKSLLAHGFYFLLVVESVGDLQRDLLLLHGGKLIIVRLMISGTSTSNSISDHFIQRFEVSVSIWLLDCVGADCIDFAGC